MLRLLLLRKDKGDPTISSTHRRRRMVYTPWKLLGKMLTSKLERYVKDARGLPKRKYDLYTISAMSDIIETLPAAQRVNHYSKNRIENRSQYEQLSGQS